MDISNRDKILNISVNLARVSDWVFSQRKQSRVDQFLKESEEYLLSINEKTVSIPFRPTLSRFKKEFKKLLQERNNIDTYDWAERALTWANILQHRAKLA